MKAGLQVALAAVGSIALPTFVVFIVLVLAVGTPDSVASPIAGPAAMWGILMGLFSAFVGMVLLAVIEFLRPSKEPA